MCGMQSKKKKKEMGQAELTVFGGPTDALHPLHDEVSPRIACRDERLSEDTPGIVAHLEEWCKRVANARDNSIAMSIRKQWVRGGWTGER